MSRTTPTKPAIEDGVIIYTHGQHPAEITQQNAALRRYCQAAGLEVTKISDVTPQPFNGCRPPKRRRV